VAQYVAKGGNEEETRDRQCLCNALFACIGMGQSRDADAVEPPLITSGDDVMVMNRFLQGRESYTAADVLAYLMPSGPVAG
jgi:nitronate monooxygenase